MSANLQKIVFPNHDKSSSEVKEYKLSDEEMKKYKTGNSETKEKDYILIQCMTKSTYDQKLIPYRNEFYKIEEDIININATKKIYKAKIKKINVSPPIFTSLIEDLKNSTGTKSIRVEVKNDSIEKIDLLAKILKVNRSNVVQRILDESLRELFNPALIQQNVIAN